MPSHEASPDSLWNDSGVRGPFVSVIIPVFNDQCGLLNCLSGLEAQSYPTGQFEVIAVDNGSTPPLELCEHHPLNVRTVFWSQPGAYAARNAGVRAARGDVLAFTDADCVPDPKWLSNGIAALLAGEEKCIIGGEVLFIQPAVRSGTALYQQAVGFQQKANVQHKGFTATANMICTRRQFQTIGPFDEQLLSGGDREWCWRATRQGFCVRFKPRIVVRTMPRTRLRDALRQARRVSAGRVHLSSHDSSRHEGLRRYRTLTQSITWICSLSHLSIWERIRVLTAGAIIRLFAAIENGRLRFGATAERR